MSNPPPRDMQPSLNGDVEARYGNASFSGPAWVFLALLVFSLLGSNIYFANRKPEASPPPGMLTKDQFDESMHERDERLNRRLDSIETDLSYVKVTNRLMQDRLPPR